METKNITAIVFDFFGVYVNNFPQQTGEALLNKFFINKDGWGVFVKKAADGLDIGTKKEEQFIEDIVSFFKIPCSPEELAKDLSSWDRQFLKVNNDLVDIIKELKGRYFIACFSNVSESLSARMDKLGLYDIFDQTFFSYNIGRIKNDSDAWEYVEHALDRKPQECLFIDDSEQNIKIAIERGWQTIHYKNNGETEQILKKLL